MAYQVLVIHGEMVARKALQVAERLPDRNPDLRFLYEAAFLHDIGMYKTHAPGIGCHSEEPYIKHGILGREMLEMEGLPRHALVCERHIGTGLSKSLIEQAQLPLPARDMQPQSLEEQLVCFADKFYSKNRTRLREEKPVGKIIAGLERHGKESGDRFRHWLREFREIE